MKKLAILILLALELAVGGCSTGTHSTTVTTSTSGNWEAQLTGGIGEASKVDFVTTFNVTNTNGASGQPLDITGFAFFNAGKCFVSGETISGSASITTLSTNQAQGTMTYTVTSGTPSGNVLTLTGTTVVGTVTNGTLSGGGVAGTWMLTGAQGDPGCTGSGNFIMCQNATTCTVT